MARGRSVFVLALALGNCGSEDRPRPLGDTGSPFAVCGRVHAPGGADQTKPGVGVSAQVGVGLVSAPVDGWVWGIATFNTGDAENDEYVASTPLPGAQGEFGFAYRFQLQGGPGDTRTSIAQTTTSLSTVQAC